MVKKKYFHDFFLFLDQKKIRKILDKHDSVFSSRQIFWKFVTFTNLKQQQEEKIVTISSLRPGSPSQLSIFFATQILKHLASVGS